MAIRTNIIVVDNFFSDAPRVRDMALAQPFRVTGNYPGTRTRSFAQDTLRTEFERLIGQKITTWRDDHTEGNYNGAFQYTLESHRSWIHRDPTSWAALIYLTPDAPPSAGTAFFRHIRTGIEEITDDIPKEIADELDADSNDMSKWEIVDFVANRFNRLVLFRGTRSHRSMDYFGTTPQTGRLFQTYFFNTADHQAIRRSAGLPAPKIYQELAPEMPNARTSTRPPNVHLIVFTTSRYEYLERMLKSFAENIDLQTHLGKVTRTLIDDYPARRDSERLKRIAKEYKFELIENATNLGYSGAWRVAWEQTPKDVDYIWHQEEDFEFLQKVRVCDMIAAYEQAPVRLSQLVLRRQRWYKQNDFADKILLGKTGTEVRYKYRKPDTNEPVETALVTQNMYFLSHPGIYPRWLLDVPLDHQPQETVIRDGVLRKYHDIAGGVWGYRLARDAISHIGDYNQGKRIDEGEPGWDTFKNVDPNIQYDSRNGAVWSGNPTQPPAGASVRQQQSLLRDALQNVSAPSEKGDPSLFKNVVVASP